MPKIPGTNTDVCVRTFFKNTFPLMRCCFRPDRSIIGTFTGMSGCAQLVTYIEIERSQSAKSVWISTTGLAWCDDHVPLKGKAVRPMKQALALPPARPSDWTVERDLIAKAGGMPGNGLTPLELDVLGRYFAIGTDRPRETKEAIAENLGIPIFRVKAAILRGRRKARLVAGPLD